LLLQEQHVVPQTITKSLRSQSTRDDILLAARRLFGERGYERTTIRAIAEAGDIHSSIVMRYYGSKEGLFAAASSFDLQLPDLSKIPRQDVGTTPAFPKTMANSNRGIAGSAPCGGHPRTS
jgi:AcrR family transcriptional regulator